ncbi:hypothetical protein CVT26_011477 [Gymnopilus dilepis]|uniref:DEAD/DEAH-box helicase domain-containing protein n=1 Tax=Gymnopilus dilepis TaxID=231916 RepID=A0A409YQK8_9AGAR|nr:hypothetical protein CVT26_011477 [Gymnopilus dilepis]
MEGHLAKDHQVTKKTCYIELVPFSDAYLAQAQRTIWGAEEEPDSDLAFSAGQIESPTASLVSPSIRSHGRSVSLDSSSLRASSPRGGHRMRPYMRISPNASRSPSPAGRGRPATRNRDSSPVGRGISPSGSFASTPVMPSPLNQVLYSRPASPSQASDLRTSTTESQEQFMDLEADDDTMGKDSDANSSNSTSEGDEPPRPPTYDQTSETSEPKSDDYESGHDIALDNNDSLLEGFGLTLVRLTYTRMFPVPQFVACTVCKQGVPPKSVIDHVKSHLRKLKHKDFRPLQEWLNLHRLAATNKDLPLPITIRPAFEALRIHKGYTCAKCSFCGTTDESMRIHCSNVHRISTNWNKTIHTAQLQTFFPSNQIYFPVQDAIANGFNVTESQDNIINAYIKQILPTLAIPSDALLQPSSDLELPPLLRITQWHQHLATYIASRSATNSILSLMKLPTSRHGEQWLGEPLRRVIHEYMLDVKAKALSAPLGVRCLLMECPRTTQKGEAFKPISDESLPKYGLLLHHWTHAIMLTLEGHTSGYQFPLTDSDKENARQLRDILKSGSTSGGITAFHHFIKPLLYSRTDSESMNEYTKWNEPVECLLAMSALREGGTFKSAHESTQILSYTGYHIRSAILYEGYANRKAFGDNLYKSVEHEAMQNMAPGLLTPYNACIDYNRFVSALAMNTNPAPNTRVSKDGMFITYGEHTLGIAKWRAGLQAVSEEISNMLKKLCIGQEDTVNIPADLEDNWRDESRGYSWTNRKPLVQDQHGLMKALIIHPDWKMGSITNGTFQYNSLKAWEYMHLADDLMDRLLFLTYNTAGQTPRIRELLDYKYANGTRPREMFMDDGDLWFATRRLKTETQTGVESFQPMKLHPALTAYFKLYLALVRPVLIELGLFLKGETTRQIYSEYLWVRGGERFKDRDAYDLIQRSFNEYCGASIGVQDYRQISIEIGRIFLGSEAEIEDEELDALAAQAGHSLFMARWKYAPEVGRLPNMTSDVVLRFARASEKWWEVTGFRPGVPPMLPLRTRMTLNSSAKPGGESSSTNLPLPQVNIAGIVQAISASVANQIQQLQVSMRKEMREAIAEGLASFLPPEQAVSPKLREPLHATRLEQPTHSTASFMQQDSVMSSTHPTEAIAELLEPPIQPLQRHQPSAPSEDEDDMYVDSPPDYRDRPLRDFALAARELLPSTLQIEARNYLEGLLQMHFPDLDHPKFKSIEQLRAAELAVERKQNFVAVLPTGGGKSLLFTLPPFNESGKEGVFQTAVIIPNKSLLEDQRGRAKKLGLQLTTWNTSMRHSVPDEVQLIFLAMETAGHPRFRE